MKTKLEKKIAKGTVLVLDTFLKLDANSASCYILYQPKVPKALEKYRRKYDGKMGEHNCEVVD